MSWKVAVPNHLVPQMLEQGHSQGDVGVALQHIRRRLSEDTVDGEHKITAPIRLLVTHFNAELPRGPSRLHVWYDDWTALGTRLIHEFQIVDIVHPG